MTAKKSFLIIFRITLILFSLQFLKDALFKWDGYSFYMRFIDFLPELALAYVLWTITAIVIAVFLWFILFVVYKLIPETLVPASLEYLVFFMIFILFPIFIKRTFYSTLSISELIGLSRLAIIFMGIFIVAIVILFARRNINKKISDILYGLDSRITPLVWLFIFIFFISLPMSFFKKSFFENEYKSGTDISNRLQINVKEASRPNIILIIMDSLSSKDIDVYGYERSTMPFISEWAKNGVVFKNIYSSSNWTTPATMSLLTGQRVWTHKVWYSAFNSPVKNYKHNLARVLKENDYNVYGLVQNGNAHPSTLGMQNDFLFSDNYLSFQVTKKWWYSRFQNLFPDRPIVNKWIFHDSFIAKKIASYSPEENSNTKPAEMVYNKFLDYMSEIKQKKTQRPFFAYLHVMPPHYAYLPPAPFMGVFGDSEKFSSDEAQWKGFAFNKEYDFNKQKDVNVLRKRYDEFVLYSDKQFELFLSHLNDVIDMTNTIVIFSSDHGESFSHGWLAHNGPHLYEPLVHIPLIIKMPGNTSGKVVDLTVEQIDIAPTILELADINVPDWMEGVSLLPLIKGEKIAARPVLSVDFQRNRSFGHPITKGTMAVWDGEYKLIKYIEDNKILLFNLKNDPDELKNIADVQPEIAERLSKYIDHTLAVANEKIVGFKE
ncbi:MAG: sulfatase-like hydrolase/transferase [Thermodesulfovibrionia bacterium]|nr:sulfatase-like hydrolase/transferase [Thermodesulfovibrionia bacterium]